MKKNLKYDVLESATYAKPGGLVTHIAQEEYFTRGEVTYEAHRI